MEAVWRPRVPRALLKRPKIYRLFMQAGAIPSQNATLAKPQAAPREPKRTKESRRQNCLRVMRTDHQKGHRRAAGHLQHLRDVQEAPPPKSGLNDVILLAQPKWPSGHATDFPPDQKLSAHGSQRSSRRFPGRDAPVGNALPWLRVWPVLQLTR